MDSTRGWCRDERGRIEGVVGMGMRVAPHPGPGAPKSSRLRQEKLRALVGVGPGKYPRIRGSGNWASSPPSASRLLCWPFPRLCPWTWRPWVTSRWGWEHIWKRPAILWSGLTPGLSTKEGRGEGHPEMGRGSPLCSEPLGPLADSFYLPGMLRGVRAVEGEPGPGPGPPHSPRTALHSWW